MLVDFNNIDDESRVWIYASEKKLTDVQQIYVLNHISDHLQNWEAHKVPLRASVKILENFFVVVALDDSLNAASGCSIDALQNRIQQIEKALAVSLMNRMTIFCVINDNIRCIPLENLSEVIDKDILFYDLTINKKRELSSWLKPLREGWCNSFLV